MFTTSNIIFIVYYIDNFINSFFKYFHNVIFDSYYIILYFNCANNWLGAQSCNGTGVDTIPGGRPFNIRKQLDDWGLNNEYT